jgi:hypothetical protein
VFQSFPWERVCLRRRYSVTATYTCLLRISCLADVVSLFVSWSLPSKRSSLDSVVGIATGYGLDDRGVGVKLGSRIFSSSHRPEVVLGSTQLPIQRLPGALSPAVKWPGCEATTHLQLVPRSRKCGSIHSPPPPFAFVGSWGCA